MRMIPLALSIGLLTCCTMQAFQASALAVNSKPSQFTRRIPMTQLAKRSEIPVEQRWKLEDFFPIRKHGIKNIKQPRNY